MDILSFLNSDIVLPIVAVLVIAIYVSYKISEQEKIQTVVKNRLLSLSFSFDFQGILNPQRTMKNLP